MYEQFTLGALEALSTQAPDPIFAEFAKSPLRKGVQQLVNIIEALNM